MTELWLGIAGIFVVSFGTRAAGALLGPRRLGPRALSVVALLAPALLTGLVVADVAGRSWRDFDVAIVVGLAACAAARLRLGGVVVPLLVAVAVTALVRLAI